MSHRFCDGSDNEEASLSSSSAGSCLRQPGIAAGTRAPPPLPTMLDSPVRSSVQYRQDCTVAPTQNKSQFSGHSCSTLPAVSDEMKELFNLVDDYEPITDFELETPLKVFYPKYFLAPGDVDSFIHIPRPDGQPDYVGTAILDESIPSKQSIEAVVELQLRREGGLSSSNSDIVRSIKNAPTNKAEINLWVQCVESRQINSSRLLCKHSGNKCQQEDVNRVLQSWPKEMTDKLAGGNTNLPSPDIDLDSREYGKALCSLLDIPVCENEGLLDSIHIMMMAYSALLTVKKMTLEEDQRMAWM
ncbi:hypothetical protein THAOC_19597 [Thalassiosira oceanica]|uniref:Intraflagellar transport protein 46 homolog n=1 Tax=Thalassiosira oceanica TaxID=159749 RepID=K0S5G5_THAOC|nr:hypothetical protein THAOC_19597 [Thalassiosira oceanica]|eukprot:EJK60114.1 hypothetical protein THAOC_19597 [Thalassiosira oceanica]